MDENNNYRNVERVPDLVGRLYEIVSELEALFPGRYFTPDGHLVGSMGEVMAAHDYAPRRSSRNAPLLGTWVNRPSADASDFARSQVPSSCVHHDP